MDTRAEGRLAAFAAAHGIIVIAGCESASVGRVAVYDARGHSLEARWSLAWTLAHAVAHPDPSRLAVELFRRS
jgi:hypothetical protein